MFNFGGLPNIAEITTQAQEFLVNAQKILQEIRDEQKAQRELLVALINELKEKDNG